MKTRPYIRICKEVKSYTERYYEIVTVLDCYEFYFTSVANCARWLGVSYNAVKLCLHGEYNLCKGYRIEYVSEKPDERDYFIDPDKYRNPELLFESGERLQESAGSKSYRRKSYKS